MKDVRTIWGHCDLNNMFSYEKAIFVESVSVFMSSRKDGCRFMLEDTTRSDIMIFGEGIKF